MNAILPPEQRTPIPRLTSKKLQRHGATRNPTTGVIQFQQTSPTLRYQHLPDYDPNETDDQIEAKLGERFEILGLMTKDAIKGKSRAMVASGPGGVGKTFTIDRELEQWDPNGDQHTSSSGYMTPPGLYKMLWKHREKNNLVKADDLDSIFYDDKSLNFIKVACDTTQKRILTYAAETILVDEDTGDPIPRRFEFNGTMIFITNLDFDVMIDRGTKLAPHLEALVTRSNYIDLGMKTKRDYLIRVFMVAETGLFDQIEGGLTDVEIDDTLNFIEKYHRHLRECSLRMALKVGSLRKDADPEESIGWERKALLTCCRGIR